MLSGDSITKQQLPGIVKRGEEFVADQSSQPSQWYTCSLLFFNNGKLQNLNIC
jgi:hypothetical protein